MSSYNDIGCKNKYLCQLTEMHQITGVTTDS